MPDQTRIVSPSPRDRTVRDAAGQYLNVPPDWVLVPPGDPGLTRRVKAAGATWTVQEKKGRKLFSRGVWASATTVEAIRRDLAAERSLPSYSKRLEASAKRREREQTGYVQSFRDAVLDFLAFDGRYQSLAERLASAVTEHATPVGSGTVARTQRIPVEQRAEAAVIAWMRHQTTAYDHMPIARVKGKRREVRRMLAERSRTLLENYRRGKELDGSSCPLQKALAQNLPATTGEIVSSQSA